MTHRNGCHNRLPYIPRRIVQDGVYEYSLTPKVASIVNFSAGQPCKYTLSPLGQSDAGCVACKWKRDPFMGLKFEHKDLSTEGSKA